MVFLVDLVLDSLHDFWSHRGHVFQTGIRILLINVVNIFSSFFCIPKLLESLVFRRPIIFITLVYCLSKPPVHLLGSTDFIISGFLNLERYVFLMAKVHYRLHVRRICLPSHIIYEGWRNRIRQPLFLINSSSPFDFGNRFNSAISIIDSLVLESSSKRWLRGVNLHGFRRYNRCVILNIIFDHTGVEVKRGHFNRFDSLIPRLLMLIGNRKRSLCLRVGDVPWLLHNTVDPLTLVTISCFIPRFFRDA